MSNEQLTVRPEPIQAGEAAPDFTLRNQDKEDWNLADHVAKGDVVLCFFPLAFTGVCSTEMKCITQEMSKWQDKGAQVVGVSCDSFATLKAWADQIGLKQTLLADMHRQVCKAYGLYWPDLNIASRGTVVVTKGTDGAPTVKWVQSREATQAMNMDEVLASLS